MYLKRSCLVLFFIVSSLIVQSQVIPSVPFVGPTGISMVPNGWAMAEGDSDFEAIPTVPIWYTWIPDPGTLTGLPPGVDRIAHTHCLDHWEFSVIGSEAIGITVPGLTIGVTYSFTAYTGGAHYTEPFFDGDVHSAMWAAPDLPGVMAMGDTPTQIGRDVSIALDFVEETWTFTATSTSMYIVLGCESANYRDWTHTSVLWAMVDPVLVTDDPDCIDLETVVSETELCDGELLTLEATSMSGGIVTWDAEVTDGVAFAPPVGITTYTATSDNLGDCPFSVDITVYDLPEVTASADDEEICLGDFVTLSGAGATSYTWDGDVTNGIAFMPMTTTTYNVTGTDAAGCENTDAVTITVNPLPNVAFTANVLDGCAPLAVNFTNLVPGSTYDWSFGDGSTSTVENPSHIYMNVGLYDVTLELTSEAGCSALLTYADYINVKAVPIANFSFNPSELDMMNTTAVFDNSSLNATEYAWTFGDGSGATATDPTHSYPANGNVSYDITLIASNDAGCEDSIVKPILVKDVLLYFVPNTFTPDGDIFNQGFTPVFVSGLDVYDFHLMIFNRWGELVFESYNVAYGWQGAYGSDGLVQEGVYIWKMEFGETMSDKLHTVDGHVTLIK